MRSITCADEPAVAVRGSRQVRHAFAEDEGVDCFALALLEQQLGEEVRERHAPRLVTLRGAGHDLACNVHGVLSH